MIAATLSVENPPPSAPVLSVSVLNRLVRERLEAAFPLSWIAGEISNLTIAASGHAYFTLKDKSAQVRCIMFRNRMQLLGWRLENGVHVEVRALVSLYEARGDFQLNVEFARRAGIGNLYEKFLQLKDRLEREGLFAQESKRPLPAFPRRIGIVTSLQAAALRDVLSTLARRSPHVAISIFPTPVQGDDAPAGIVAALQAAGMPQNRCEVLIVCRGGGSLEDLWAFNDENVARAMRACPMPVISGVGHETDFTIADFVADRRAATPTAAAELAAPARDALQGQFAGLAKSLLQQFVRRQQTLAQRLDLLAHRLLHPGQRIERQREQLASLRYRLDTVWRQTTAHRQTQLAAIGQRLRLSRPDPQRQGAVLSRWQEKLETAWRAAHSARTHRLAAIEAGLLHLDPQRVTARGYSIVSDADGRILRSAGALEPNDTITVSFHAGRADARITSVQT